jgi:hypothetical protein
VSVVDKLTVSILFTYGVKVDNYCWCYRASPNNPCFLTCRKYTQTKIQFISMFACMPLPLEAV